MKKIAVLGMGPSWQLFKPEEFELSIGVNDIWRLVKCDVVVCLNPPRDFTSDRLKVINECKPAVFYSQLVIWDSRPDFRKIDLIPGYPDISCQIENRAFYKSYCSPFVAVQIAYKYYFAKEIHLFGVDMTNHPHLDLKICGHIIKHFRNLKTALALKGCELAVFGSGILKDL
jgi:hypothetical protein